MKYVTSDLDVRHMVHPDYLEAGKDVCQSSRSWNKMMLKRLSTFTTERHSSSPRLSLLSLLTNTLPGPSASEVTTLWRYTNLYLLLLFLV